MSQDERMCCRSRLRSLGLATAFVLLCAFLSIASSTEQPAVSFVSALEYFEEPEATSSGAEEQQLSLAIRAYTEGRFASWRTAGASLGIDRSPVWLSASLHNRTELPQASRLTVGATWTDRLDVYLVRDGETIATWQVGDEVSGAAHVQPGVGFVFPVDLPPGQTRLYVRIRSADPLLVPLKVQSVAGALAGDRMLNYWYGFLYGFLLALTVYALLLWLKLDMRAYLYYALYLLSFVALNLAYTGHGLYYWWPSAMAWQRYVILVLMIVFAQSGLRFAVNFVELDTSGRAPRRGVDLANAVAFGGIVLLVIADLHRAAVVFAFAMTLLANLAMIVLGPYASRIGRDVGRFYWAAVICGATGAALTQLTSLGVMPLPVFHASEIGLTVEGILLAVALSSLLHRREASRRVALLEARHDPLTGLNNRRAFYELAASPWNNALRDHHAISMLLIDIDYFKAINDQYGHSAGDAVLRDFASVLALGCRSGDIAARWGGEEFVVLLPNTNRAEAYVFAQRLREFVTSKQMAGLQGASVTASFGLATRQGELEIDELVDRADEAVYRAKSSGRDCIVVAEQLKQRNEHPLTT